MIGTTDKLAEETVDLSGLHRVVIVRLRNMTAIDATCLHELKKVAQRLTASGRTLVLCGARDQPAQLLDRSDFAHEVGPENIAPHVEAALSRAEEIVAMLDPVRMR